MKLSHRYAILVSLAAAIAIPAQSANITFNETIDLNQWVSSSFYLTGTNPVTISDGDTVTINYDFAGTQALKLTNLDGSSTTYAPAWPWLLTQNYVGSFQILNASTTLINASFVGGSGATTEFQASQSSSAAHLGLYSFLELDALTSVQFTGVSSTFTVDYLPGGTNDYVSWFTNWGLSSVQVDVVSSNTLPDQGSTVALFSLAVVGLAAFRRRFQP